MDTKDITDAINEVLEYQSNPPPNESTTCEWVILHLLYAIGYSKREVLSHTQDSGGKFPDYTVLQNDPERVFYLEAKAWQIELEDNHARQALDYANHNGKRWVVLTNGRTWRLYDNDIRARPEGKLVAEARLEDQTELARFLAGISKQSVCSDGLERFASEEAAQRRKKADEKARAEVERVRRSHLEWILRQTLKDEASPIVSLLLKYLKGLPELESITARDVIACLGSLTVGNHVVQPTPLGGGVSEEVLVVPAAEAWPEYLKLSAYICQPNRSFRSVNYMAFYHEGAIERSIPRILGVVEEIELSERAIKSPNPLSDSQRARLLSLVKEMTVKEVKRSANEKFKVIFLSANQSTETIILPKRIENDTTTQGGRPWAFVVGQRYVPLKKLLAGPATTSELLKGD